MNTSESALSGNAAAQNLELSPSELEYRLLMDNFITPEECRELIALADKYGTVGGGYGEKVGQSNSDNEVYIGYFLKESQPTEEFRKEHEVALRILNRVRKQLMKHFGLPFLWIDHAEILSREPTQPQEGAPPEDLSMDWHMDNHGPLIWRRTHTGILYLNDDYEGGHTCMKEADWGPFRELPPATGRLIGFNAVETPHAVTKVTSGKRYTMIMWFSNHWTNVRRHIKVFNPKLANALGALKRPAGR
ncbi:MAG: 2OG-Fe(II) oxygenase [Gammaproteobacteria bacterium]|jgi:hypothetical protein|nr:2OG-Fe(II) oxygenase [Gammaproteobacteria bacterium]MDP6615658.1 2OG-Fe(II) oxygenase [Gammaproteobacteria bacterium]MDP6694685.1 2OG-Fe(II) oxygenase [Gammaproteobacteria bacterium]